MPRPEGSRHRAQWAPDEKWPSRRCGFRTYDHLITYLQNRQHASTAPIRMKIFCHRCTQIFCILSVFIRVNLCLFTHQTSKSIRYFPNSLLLTRCHRPAVIDYLLSSATKSQTRNTSATLHACAIQPCGWCGASASAISLIEPTHPSAKWSTKGWSK